MKISFLRLILPLAAALTGMLYATSCSDDRSYAELLNQENKVVNFFLADQRVSNEIPADTNFVFETGENAPYYKMDEDGNVYMQVVSAGTKGNYAKENETIYFRYTRYSLSDYSDGKLPTGSGNESDMTVGDYWFRYDNYQLQSSYQWGSGIQLPLKYLPIDCVVNVVIKSQYGFYEETSYVMPYLFRLRYYRQLT